MGVGGDCGCCKFHIFKVASSDAVNRIGSTGWNAMQRTRCTTYIRILMLRNIFIAVQTFLVFDERGSASSTPLKADNSPKVNRSVDDLTSEPG
uniref:Uncharacterized protein n=1 Tax=Romanomermis culicivorax TaxID=13658 RepID=A0A915K449_ROMCU